MGSQIERGGTHQCGEPGDRRGCRRGAVGFRQQLRQALFDEALADLQGMPGLRRLRPGARDRFRETAQRLQPLRVGDGARPYPLHAERCLAQPTAVPVPAPLNSTLARAQMTDVVTSGPNFSGTRVVTGR